MPKKRLAHGGRRPGAGRPAIYRDRGKVSVVMEQSLINAATQAAARDGVSLSQYVAEALRAWLERGK